MVVSLPTSITFPTSPYFTRHKSKRSVPLCTPTGPATVTPPPPPPHTPKQKGHFCFRSLNTQTTIYNGRRDYRSTQSLLKDLASALDNSTKLKVWRYGNSKRQTNTTNNKAAGRKRCRNSNMVWHNACNS